jgi:YVTN family beta-propeller protein
LFEGGSDTCVLSGLALADDDRFAYAECSIGSGFGFHVLKIDLSSRSIVDSVNLTPYSFYSDDFVGVPPSNIHVANGTSASVSVLDSVTRTSAELSSVGAEPVAAVVSSDSRWLYAANKIDDSISVVSIATGMPVATIPTGAGPDAVALSPDNSLLYVANETDNSITLIDTGSRSVLDTIAIDDPNHYGQPRSIALSPDGHRLYAALSNGYDIYVMDTATRQPLAPFYCNSGVASLALSPDGSVLYATNGQNNGVIYQIDAQTGMVLDKWDVYPVTAAIATDAIAVSPDGTRIYVGSSDTPGLMLYASSVATIDSASGAVLGYVALDGAPASLAAGSEGRYVYAAIAGKDEVSIVDTATQRVVESVKAFHGPTSIAPIVEPLPNLIYHDGFGG